MRHDDSLGLQPGSITTVRLGARWFLDRTKTPSPSRHTKSLAVFLGSDCWKGRGDYFVEGLAVLERMGANADRGYFLPAFDDSTITLMDELQSHTEFMHYFRSFSAELRVPRHDASADAALRGSDAAGGAEVGLAAPYMSSDQTLSSRALAGLMAVHGLRAFMNTCEDSEGGPSREGWVVKPLCQLARRRPM